MFGYWMSVGIYQSSKQVISQVTFAGWAYLDVHRNNKREIPNKSEIEGMMSQEELFVE